MGFREPTGMWFYLKMGRREGLKPYYDETDANALWHKVETLYASKTCNNKLTLLKQAIKLAYEESMSIFDQLN